MTKIKTCITVSLLAILFLGAFGVSLVKSYTNISKQPNYLNSVLVAEISQKLAAADCKNMIRDLPKANYILRVSASGEVEHLFNISRQKVRVNEIYAGDALMENQEIYITTDRWSLNTNNEGKEAELERGFINILRADREYLVFCSEKINALNETVPIYRLCEDSIISPVFCYESVSNQAFPTQGISTYVPYSNVKENEFFGCTSEAIEEWENLKRQLTAMYGLQ